VSDKVVLLVLQQPFSGPCIEEKLPTSSFRGIARLATGRRYKAIGRHKISEGDAYLLRGFALGERLDKGQ
jgi:hypothetical protein